MSSDNRADPSVRVGSRRLRVLHVAAEAAPFLRTGGLGDVVGALPAAQASLGADVRVLIPGYPSVLAGIDAPRVIAAFAAPNQGGFCRLLAAGPAAGDAATTLPPTGAPNRPSSPSSPASPDGAGDFHWYVLDCPWRFERGATPYEDDTGRPWPDNALRFGLLAWVAAQLGAGGLDSDWRPDLVHVHDWHAALTPWWLRSRPGLAVPTALSVHNIGYQGLYPPSHLGELGLPSSDWHPGGLEFHGQLSFLKAGIVAATGVGTVSPTHAGEILTPAIGHGLDGVLRHRGDAPVGILNGIDIAQWNPATDRALVQPFDPTRFDATLLAARDRNRVALAGSQGLASGRAPAGNDRPLLLGLVSRFAEQKGIDLIAAAAPALFDAGCDLIVLGSGDRSLERSLATLAARFPDRMSTRIGFDEALSRQIYGGADAILVPSRYEPCGLTQMYAMRYGALPIVRRTGGLADTVNDGNGFVFDRAEPEALIAAGRAARAVFDQPEAWRSRMATALATDHSWPVAARRYLDWYGTLIQAPRQL